MYPLILLIIIITITIRITIIIITTTTIIIIIMITMISSYHTVTLISCASESVIINFDLRS